MNKNMKEVLVCMLLVMVLMIAGNVTAQNETGNVTLPDEVFDKIVNETVNDTADEDIDDREKDITYLVMSGTVIFVFGVLLAAAITYRRRALIKQAEANLDESCKTDVEDSKCTE